MHKQLLMLTLALSLGCNSSDLAAGKETTKSSLRKRIKAALWTKRSNFSRAGIIAGISVAAILELRWPCFN